MGNKRNLKRTINYICGDLFTEVIAASLYGDNVNKENIEYRSPFNFYRSFAQ